jgi:hypothetical protein
MRRFALATTLVLLSSGVLYAKFGMTKTKVKLPRLRPPDIVLAGPDVSVDVKASTRRITDSQIASVRDRIEQVLQAGGTLRVVATAKADSRIKVSLDELETEIDQDVEYEEKYVKTGTRQEYDAGKKKYVTKDVYGNKQVAVDVTRVVGRLNVRVDVEQAGDASSADGLVEYNRTFKESSLPDEAKSESNLEDWLIAAAGVEAAAKVAPSPDPVEALLAVDKQLKTGNELAERGAWREALALWDRLKLKGDTEASRLHNVGVAHEALAYALPLDHPEHRAELDQAAENYAKARSLDPGEKYFAEPLERIQTSIRYSDTALKQAEERRMAEARMKSAPTKAPATVKPGAAKPGSVSAKPAGAASSALRNGTFDGVLSPWLVDGEGMLKQDKARGGTFEGKGTEAEPTTLSQPVSADLGKAAAATVRLKYKVAAGEGRLKFFAVYQDAGGRSRTHSADVTAGEGPGAWSDWSADLAALRPKPAKLSELRLQVAGGTLLLDDVALEIR